MAIASTTVRSWGPLPGDGCAIRAAGGCCQLCEPDGETAIQPSVERTAAGRADSLAPVLRVTPEACLRVFGDELDCY